MARSLSDAERDQVHAAVFAGRKIAAIKAYREATGEGLKESKDAVEALEAELRASAPGRFSPTTPKGGCMPVMLLGLTPALIEVWRRW